MRTDKRQRIRFSFKGKRCEFSIPASSKTYVTNLNYRIKQLISRELTGEPNIALDRWVAECPTHIREPLCKFGLLQTAPVHTMNEILAKYKVFKPELTESTWNLLSQSVAVFNKYFGENRDLSTISEEEAFKFKSVIATVKIGNFAKLKAEATCAKHLSQLKILTTFAKRKRYISENPFETMPITKKPNTDRQYFVGDEECQKIINACPTLEWKTIFAAARYVGMRCPSELRELRWNDITWSDGETTGLIHIRDQKRKRYVSKRDRVSPLFADAEIFFRELYDAAKPEATDKILPKVPTNIRDKFLEIIKKAGVDQYPKPFQNLRSTRETEYHRAGISPDEYTRWLGNSPKIANDHYIQRDAVSFQSSVMLFKKSKECTEKPPPEIFFPTKVPTHLITTNAIGLHEFLADLVFYARMALDGIECKDFAEEEGGNKFRVINRVKSLMDNALQELYRKGFPQKSPQTGDCETLPEILDKLQALIDGFSV